jgi:hypothetical protein
MPEPRIKTTEIMEKRAGLVFMQISEHRCGKESLPVFRQRPGKIDLALNDVCQYKRIAGDLHTEKCGDPGRGFPLPVCSDKRKTGCWYV